MKKMTTFLLLFGAITAFSQNQAPQISNINITINDDEFLTIQYDLSDTENDEVMVSFRVKKNDGNTFSINTDNATGDLGMQTVGMGKIIEWNYAAQLNESDDYVIKLIADDLQIVDIQSIVDQVDSMSLLNDLLTIEGVRHRTAGVSKLNETRDLIEQRFLDYELETEMTSFPFGSFTGENFIGTKTGTTQDEVIYICDAHYDSVDDAPGADDNGSGVVGFLEAARVLSNYNFKKTIQFIGFDLEEVGLKGSENYVLETIAPEEEIAGVLNFEMIGYYTEVSNSQSFPAGFNLLFPDSYQQVADNGFKGDFIANIGLEGQNDWEQAYANAAATYVPDLKVVTFVSPPNWFSVAPDLGRSDHAPFWLSDRPAVMLTGTAEFRNQNYHSPADTVGTLNFTFMSNVVKAAVATLAEEAEIQNSTFVEETVDLMVNSTSSLADCSLQVFPNPVRDWLRFDTKNCHQQSSPIRIYDIAGKLVFAKENFSFSNKIEVNNWEAGVYFFEIGDGKHRFVVGK